MCPTSWGWTSGWAMSWMTPPCAYLKDFGAATASNGAVGLYHIDAPDPRGQGAGTALIAPDAKEYVYRRRRAPAGQGELSARLEEPRRQTQALLCGLPHLSLQQLKDWDRPSGNGAEGKRPHQGLRAHRLHHRPRRQEGLRDAPPTLPGWRPPASSSPASAR